MDVKTLIEALAQLDKYHFDMDVKPLIEALELVDKDHFVIVENDCVEVYRKEEYFATPVPTDFGQ